MRKKPARALSMLLAASLVLSSVGPGTSAMAAGAGYETVEEQQVSEASQKPESQADESAAKMPEEDVQGEANMVWQLEDLERTDKAKRITMEVRQSDTEVEDAGKTATVDEPESEEELLEDAMDVKQALPADSELVKNVIKDDTLRAAVLKRVNTKYGTSYEDDEFTYAILQGYGDKLDFTDMTDAAEVKDISGLGSARNAQSIDISTFTNVTKIPDNEFAQCSFTKINLPSGLTAIGKKAFAECKNLEEIVLPANLSVLGEQAFSGCKSLKKVDAGEQTDILPKSLRELGQQAFANTALEQITIPSFDGDQGGTILQNASSLFALCTKLKHVTIGAKITTIPLGAFQGAGTETDGLEVKFEAGSQLDKIMGSAFYMAYLNSTLDLSMCKNLTSIEDAAFMNTKVERETQEPNPENEDEMITVTRTYGLETVILPTKESRKTLSLGSNVFADTLISTIYEDGSIQTLEVILPEYISVIGAGCFYGDTELRKVSLPSGIPEIPDYLFDGCEKLAEVEQRQAADGTCQVKAIGDCAFRSTAITNTDFMMKMNQLETIGYEKLENIGTVHYPTAEENEITSLPTGGVGSKVVDKDTHEKESPNGIPVGSEVFTDCKALKTVTIPASVQTIAARAFYFPCEWSIDVNESDGLTIERTSGSIIETIHWASLESGSNSKVERTIHMQAFSGNMKVESITLPNNAGESLNIEDCAFCCNVSLKQIGGTLLEKNVLPKTVKRIGEGAFFDCEKLGNITIQSTDTTEDGCPELGIKVFKYCWSLTEATVPQEITEIPRHFFFDAPIETFNVGDNSKIQITRIGALAFMGNQFTTLDLSGYTALEEIGSGAYASYDAVIEPEEPEKQSQPAYYAGILKTVILPTTMEQDVFLNTGVFYDQTEFDTMKTKDGDERGRVDQQIYIPDYLYQSNQQAIFAYTGVSKMVWQADTTGKNEWIDIPVMMYEGCQKITKAEDVLPTGSYVENIGKGAFAASSIQSADLSNDTSLRLLCSGSLAGGGELGVFQGCSNLTDVKLPITVPKQSEESSEEESSEEESNDGMVVGVQCFMASPVTKVDLGNAVELEKSAFEACDKLVEIKFPESLLAIGDDCFKTCEALTTVDFGKLKSIGNTAFVECNKLVLSKGLPDELEYIGSGAFKEDESIGEVKFGPQLETIDSDAFADAAVTKLDFERATHLETINGGAFSGTPIDKVEIKNTKVATIPTSLFSGCTNLTSASFGDEVAYISEDALAACTKLRKLDFACTTTVNSKVFRSRAENGDCTGGGSPITITVNTPETTVVPLNGSMYLPYYVNEKDESDFEYILIGAGAQDESVQEYLQVSAKLNDGYYWGRQSDDENGKYQITDSAYYNKLAETPSIPRPDNDGIEVDAIQVTGKKVTQEPVSFSVGSTMTFAVAPEEGSDKDTYMTIKFSADYKIEIRDIPLHTQLFRDAEREDALSEGAEDTEYIQVARDGEVAEYYYSITSLTPDQGQPNTYDLVIETDNKDVLYPAGSEEEDVQESYQTEDATDRNAAGTEVSPIEENQRFLLIPKKVGTAHIKVYPAGHVEHAQTFTFVVHSDISEIILEVPESYTEGVKEGDEFSIFSSYTNYLGQTVNQENMENYTDFTNREISYSCDPEGYVQVDSQGKVKVLKGDKAGGDVRTVTITATATGNDLTASVELSVQPNDPVFALQLEAIVFQDEQKTQPMISGQSEAIQIDSEDNAMLYYFNVESLEEDRVPDTYDMVIETDRADVLYPAGSDSGTAQSSYTTTEGTSAVEGSRLVTPNEAGQVFWLIPAGAGTANIKVYPKGHPALAKVYTFVVNSDIKTLKLAVPEAYSEEAGPGVSFNVFASYENYLGQTVTGAADGNYRIYSNRIITYTSDTPDYVSVDANGNVMVLKADADSRDVKITASAPTTKEGDDVTAEVTLHIKYPEIKAGDSITDPVTGVTVALSQIADGDSAGEATYLKPSDASADTVTIPDTVTVNNVPYRIVTVDPAAFKGNTTVKKVVIGKYVTGIQAGTFSGCTALTKVTIGSAVTTIGNKAFYNCKKLKTVTIPKNGALTQIGKSAFQNCTALTKITIPAKVTKIGAKAFYNCKKLKTVTFAGKSKLTQIGNSAFQGCSVLAKITIPSKVTKIGSMAFCNCKKLKSITVKSTVLKSVGKNAFKNIYKKATIKVPAKKLEKYKTLLKGKGQSKTVQIKK